MILISLSLFNVITLILFTDFKQHVQTIHPVTLNSAEIKDHEDSVIGDRMDIPPT